MNTQLPNWEYLWFGASYKLCNSYMSGVATMPRTVLQCSWGKNVCNDLQTNVNLGHSGSSLPSTALQHPNSHGSCEASSGLVYTIGRTRPISIIVFSRYHFVQQSPLCQNILIPHVGYVHFAYITRPCAVLTHSTAFPWLRMWLHMRHVWLRWAIFTICVTRRITPVAERNIPITARQQRAA